MAKKNNTTMEQDELLSEELELSLESVESGAMLDSVKEYLREIGQYRLLTAQEEQQLSSQIHAGRDADLLLEQGEEDPERKALLHQLVRQGEEAHERLVNANLRLVVLIAKKYLNRGLSLLDLIQEGNIGLMKAASEYSSDRGTRFSTYAAWWIRQGISRAVTDCGRTIRLPSHIFHQVAHLRKAVRELSVELDRKPTEEEIAQRLGITVKKVKALQAYDRDASSLDAPLGGDDDGTVIDVTPGDSPMDEVDDDLTRQALISVMRRAVETLPQREASVLSLRYGLLDGRTYTLDQVGQRIGLTRERVRQIERKALRMLASGECAAQLRAFIA